MNKKRMLYLIIAVVLVGALFVLLFNSSSSSSASSKRSVAFSSSNWEANLTLNNKDPYGLFIFKELMLSNHQFDQFNTISDYHLLDSITQLDSSMFMFIGMDFMLTDKEIDELLHSVEYGNDFFLSAENMPAYLIDHLFEENTLVYYPKEKAPHKINEKEYDMYYFYENDTLTEMWDMFNPRHLDSSTVIHSTIYGRPNFIEIEYGLGKVYLHLNPLVFTNVQLLEKDGKSYLKEVLRTLDQPKVQWLSFAEIEPQPYDASSTEFDKDQSLLSELFKHPAFRWGFILAVFGLILYLLFRSKRSRPIIPEIEDNKNTGFSYVDTLAGIYFNRDHGDKILKIMRRNFYSAVYAHFYIDLAKREDRKPIIALSKKSNVPLEEIEQLIKFLEVSTSVSDTFLSNTYKVKRAFYFKSGIWNEEVKEKLKQGSIEIYRQKGQALGTIGIGAFIILLGFIFLSMSLGVGVLFWPLGVIAIAIGVRMLNLPALKINQKSLLVYPLIGKSTVIPHENIKFIDEKRNILIIYTRDSKEVKLSLSQLEARDNKAIQNLKQRFKPH